MRRRNLLAAASGSAVLAGGLGMSDGVQAVSFESLKGLQKSPRLPVLFLGHGSPMNAIEDNEYRRSWQARAFLQALERFEGNRLDAVAHA